MLGSSLCQDHSDTTKNTWQQQRPVWLNDAKTPSQGVLFTVLFINSLRAWGRNAALSHSPEPALPELQEGSFWSSLQTSNKKSHSLFPHSQRTATRLFSRGTGIKTGQWEEGGEGNTHAAKAAAGGDTKRHSPLFRVPDALYCSGTWLHFLALGEWRWRGRLAERWLLLNWHKLKTKHCRLRPTCQPVSAGHPKMRGYYMCLALREYSREACLCFRRQSYSDDRMS